MNWISRNASKYLATRTQGDGKQNSFGHLFFFFLYIFLERLICECLNSQFSFSMSFSLYPLKRKNLTDKAKVRVLAWSNEQRPGKQAHKMINMTAIQAHKLYLAEVPTGVY